MPSTSAWNRSGYWVTEWLPQIVILVTSLTVVPVLARQLADGTVVVEAGHRREPLRVEIGCVAHRDQRVGVGRVADDEDLDVLLRARR